MNLNVVNSCGGNAIFSTILHLIASFSYSSQFSISSTERCILTISCTALDTLRIWAICQHQWAPTAVVFLLGFYEFAFNLVSTSTSQSVIFGLTHLSIVSFCPPSRLHFVDIRPGLGLLDQASIQTICLVCTIIT